MSGLQKIELKEVLLLEEQAWTDYNAGQWPLACRYLSKSVIEEINRVIYRYNNNDEHRRYLSLNFPSAEQAAFAMQEALQIALTFR